MREAGADSACQFVGVELAPQEPPLASPRRQNLAIVPGLCLHQTNLCVEVDCRAGDGCAYFHGVSPHHDGKQSTRPHWNTGALPLHGRLACRENRAPRLSLRCACTVRACRPGRRSPTITTLTVVCIYLAIRLSTPSLFARGSCLHGLVSLL